MGSYLFCSRPFSFGSAANDSQTENFLALDHLNQIAVNELCFSVKNSEQQAFIVAHILIRLKQKLKKHMFKSFAVTCLLALKAYADSEPSEHDFDNQNDQWEILREDVLTY